MSNTESAAAPRPATSNDYQKTISVKSEPGALFDALTTVDGVAGWWTAVSGSGETGGELRFRFDPPEPCVMHVDQATRPSVVQWTVTSCPFLPDWVGTRPTFTITPVDADTCELDFRHLGLTADLDCIEECSRGWDHFLMSLRDYAEVGRGMPRGGEADTTRRG